MQSKVDTPTPSLSSEVCASTENGVIDSRADRRDPDVAMEFTDKPIRRSSRAIMAPDRYCNASSRPASDEPSSKIDKENLLGWRVDGLGSSPIIFVKLLSFVSSMN
jgi:hypothetical protein